MSRTILLFHLLLMACASKPAAEHELEVSLFSTDRSSTRRPRSEFVYEVAVGNQSEETIFLSQISVEPWQAPGMFRNASVHPNLTMEPGEFHDFTIFAELDARALSADEAWRRIGSEAPTQMRVVVSYRVGSEERVEVHDVSVKRP